MANAGSPAVAEPPRDETRESLAQTRPAADDYVDVGETTTVLLERNEGEMLGLELASIDNRNGVDIGVQVIEVSPGGPGAKAGLDSGDVFMSLEGQPIRNQPYDDVLEMIKGKLRLKLEVVHGSLKPVKQFVLDRQNGEKLGLELANVNDNSEAGVGCQVVKVHPGGLGQEAGVEQGDIFQTINGEDVQQKPYNEILDLLKNGTHLVIDAVAGNVRDGEVYSRLVQLDSARIGIEIEEMNDKGVRVKDVVAGGAAAKSGQVRIGDHILQINGVDVSQVRYDEALEVISKAKENPTIEFTLIEEISADPEPAVGPNAMPPIIENSVRKVVIPASDTGYGLKIMSHPQRKGIMVSEVVAGSPAALATPAVYPNDVIMSINDMHALELDHEAAMTKIQACRSAGADLQLLVAAASDHEAVKRTVTIHKGASTTFGIGIMVDASANFRVFNIAKNSPADAAGVQASERIISIDGVELVDPDAWQAWVDHLQTAAEVTLVTIPDDSPLEDEGAERSVRNYRVARGPNGFGMSLKSDKVTKGVRVAAMVPGGPAQTAGIQEGDVLIHINGEYVFDKSHDDVVAALAQSDSVANIEVQHRSAVPGGERLVELDCANGAGIKYGIAPGDEYPQIMELMVGMPAEKSNQILIGDRIHKVNDVSLQGKSHAECDELLRQEKLSLILETGEPPNTQITQTGAVAYSTAVIEKPSVGPLGLEMQSEHFGTSGALGMMITSVTPNTPASRCPDIAAGDVVHAINGTSIDSSTHDEVVEILRRAPPGPITLQVVRFQRRHEVILVRPEEGGLGVLLQSDHEGYGARVRDIIPNTPTAAAQAKGEIAVGMRILAVNGVDVYNLPHNQVIGLISMGKQVTLLVQEDVMPMPQQGSEALLHAKSISVNVEKQANSPIGVRFMSDRDVLGHVVTQVLPGTPGDSAGLEPGMVITKVNGVDVTHDDVAHADVVKMIAEAEGTIQLTVGHLEHIPGAVTVTVPRHPNGLGLALSSLGNQNAGVLVSNIIAGGNASRTEARKGMRVVMANGDVLLKADHGTAIAACASGDKECAVLTLLSTHHKLPDGNAPEVTEDIRTVTLPRDTGSNLGLVIATGREGVGAFVQTVLPNSVAANTGRVYAGDRIITLDGTKCDNLDHDAIIKLLSSHSTIVMTVTHDKNLANQSRATDSASRPLELPPMTPRMTREIVNGIVCLDGRGIGASISTEEEEMGVRISEIDPNGAIGADGIFKVGDHITQIENVDVSAADHDYVVQLLREKGESGFNFYMVTSREVPTPLKLVKTIISRPQDGSPLGMKLLDYADVGPTKGVKGTYVGSVTHGSPTYDAGEIQPGDRIVEVNGTSAEGLSHPEIYKLITGAEGPTLEIVTERAVSAKPVKGIRRTLHIDHSDPHAEPLGLSFMRRHEECTIGAHRFFGVVHVDIGSEADRAGFHEGDLILEVGDHVVRADDTHTTLGRLLAHVGRLQVVVEGAEPFDRIENDHTREVYLYRDPRVGFGVKFSHPAIGSKKYPRVLAVLPGTPAAAYGRGIKIGDNLLAVNGVHTEGVSDADLASLLKTEKAICVFGTNDTHFPELDRLHNTEFGFPSKFVDISRNNHQGFGFEFATFGEDNFTAIRSIERNSPAGKSNLAVADVIVMINKEFVLHEDHDVILNMMRRVDHLEITAVRMSDFDGFNIAQLEKAEGKPFGVEFSSKMAPSGDFRHRVTQVDPESPAGEDGAITYGDQIRCLNGIPVCDMSHDMLLAAIAGLDRAVILLKHDASDVPRKAEDLAKAAPRWTEKRRLEHDIRTKAKNGTPAITVYKERGVLGVRVLSMDEKNTAEHPLVRPHDVILEVNRTSVIGWTAEEVQNLLDSSKKRKARIVVAPNQEIGEELLHRRTCTVYRNNSPDQKLGLEFESKEGGKGARVVDVLPDGAVAAAKCDIKKGDDIVEVNGETTFDLDHDKVVDLFSSDQTECVIVVQDNHLPMDVVKDYVTGTTRTVVLNRGDGGLGLHIAGNQSPFQVSAITPGSAADSSNAVFVGDVIREVNGNPVESLDHDGLISAIQEQNPVTFEFASSEAPLMMEPSRVDGATQSRTVHIKKTGGVLGLALIDGNIVQRVMAGTPAAQSDLAEGDHIISVDGIDVSEIQDSEEVISIIRAAGEDVCLNVVSDQKALDRPVVLDKAKFGGLGIVITSTPENSADPVLHYVKEIIPGKAAAATNAVFESDEIVEVNGEKTRGRSHNDLKDMLLAKDSVKLVLRRGLVPANTSAADIANGNNDVAFTATPESYASEA